MSEVRLKRLFRSVSGGSWGTEPEEGEVTLPCIRGTDFDYPALRSTIATAPIRGFSRHEVARRAAQRGDLIIEKSGGGEKQPVGRVVLHDFDDLVMPTNFASRLTPTEANESRFLTYLMSSLYAVGSTKSSIKQTTGIQNLDVQSFLDTVIFQPSLPEQRTIVDFLDAETARIDALIEKKRRMIEVLGERDRRMVDECFTPREGESLVRLARFADVQTGVTLHEGRALDGDAVTRPYLRVANVQPGWLDLSEVKTVTLPKAMAIRSKLQPGDVLMTEGGDRDKLGRGTVWRGEILDCLHQNHVFAVRPYPLSLDSDYLSHLTRTSHARAYFEMTAVQSTNLASTSSSKVSDFKIPALSIDEQRDRVGRYQTFSEKNRRISAALTEQLELLTEHRQALITAAVTGQVEVPESTVSQ